LIEFGILVLKIKKKFNVFLLFRYYPPLEKGYPLPFNKRNFHLPQDDLYQVGLKLALWFWRRRFLNDPTPFLHFCDYLTFEKDLALSLTKPEFSSNKNNVYHV
jgi:hypothetical protein